MKDSDKPTKEHNGSTKEDNGNSKEQNGSRNLSKPMATMPGNYRRGTSMSAWGHEPFRRMREEFDRMFEQFFGNWPTLADRSGHQMHWGLDLHEDDGSIVVRAEAPGFEPGDFDLEVRGDQLMLHASHRAESRENQAGHHEWQQQEFYRSVPLPQGTDPEKVEANYRNGVLTVTLAKTEESKGRHIPVKG